MAERKNNYPTVQQPDLKPAEIGNQIAFFEQLRKLPRVNLRDVKALEERIRLYFDLCSRNGIRPGVSALALSLGVSRQYMWRIEQESSASGELICNAKQVIEGLTEQWALTGKINPTTWIFYGKNYFGMTDSYQLEAKPVESTLDRLPNREDIVKRLPSRTEFDEEPEIDI